VHVAQELANDRGRRKSEDFLIVVARQHASCGQIEVAESEAADLLRMAHEL
jgi:hypothetical protein